MVEASPVPNSVSLASFSPWPDLFSGGKLKGEETNDATFFTILSKFVKNVSKCWIIEIRNGSIRWRTNF